ncbi:MAG: DNA pilot protein [Microvirus sp.]|nr:MAG: DNA pilot protein [Microvirus sp.]
MKSKRHQRGFWNFLIPAAATLIGAKIGADGQERANEANINLSKEQMAFQERMSSTAYTRAVGDMTNAGLNPMLAYSQGGASAPMGSMPKIENAAGAGVASAAQVGGTIAGIQQILQSKAATDQLVAQTAKIESETMEKNLNTARLAAEVKRGEADAYVANQTQGDRVNLTRSEEQIKATQAGRDTQSFSADVARRKADSQLTVMEIARGKADEQFYKGLGEGSPYIKMILDIMRSLSSARQATRP